MSLRKQNSHDNINSDLREIFGDGSFPCKNCTMETIQPSHLHCFHVWDITTLLGWHYISVYEERESDKNNL